MMAQLKADKGKQEKFPFCYKKETFLKLKKVNEYYQN